MRTLLIAIAAVAFLAAPAMAEVVASPATVDAKLTIEAYAYLVVDNDAAGTTGMTITLTSGHTENEGGIWGSVVCNVASTMTPTIVEEGSAVGDWSLTTGAIACPPGQTLWAIGVRVENVPEESPPITGIKQATVTITVTTP